MLNLNNVSVRTANSAGLAFSSDLQNAINTILANLGIPVSTAGGSGGISQSTFHSYLDNYPNKDDYKDGDVGNGIDETTFHNNLDSYANKDDWKGTANVGADVAKAVWEYDLSTISSTTRTWAGNVLERMRKALRLIQAKG